MGGSCTGRSSVEGAASSSTGDEERHPGARGLGELEPHDALEQIGVEMRLDVVGEAVDVVGGRRGARAQREATRRPQAVDEGGAERRVVEEAVDVAAADGTGGGAAAGRGGGGAVVVLGA